MITWIGLCAGEVWRYLESHNGEAKFKAIVSGIKAPKETIHMALGWLARENNIIIGDELPNPTVRLVDYHQK
ncbi:MAG TPA: winged helix-turn-helix domain-containing protein [Verrucomicrobiae bacterium]|jgi:hypothetical protein|nr:winged helix-turn-helix domain-containing protein [Verrucomicrobiae bacterium]